MITCPECGLEAPDDAKFCDRCGHGFARAVSRPAPATRPTPLLPGKILKGGYEIVELTVQTSNENRYRARRTRDGKLESYALRERFGPAPAHAAEATPPPVKVEPEPSPTPTPVEEDPNGPHAKTAELKPRHSEPNGSAPAPTASNPTVSHPDDGGHRSTTMLEAVAVEHATAAEEEAPHSAAPEAEAALLAELSAEGNAVVAMELTPGESAAPEVSETSQPDDLGDAFGRVMALSLTLNHPAFQRALEGFADGGRVYLAYADEELKPVHRAGQKLSEPDAIAATIQICQAVSFLHRRGLRLNDICPQSVAVGADGRVRFTGLEYVSNDNERQSEPLFNDGYTAPEIYKERRVDKRADIFSTGALLYTFLTGERLAAESWREEAGPIQFYPPHVVSPKLEQAVRRALAFDPKDRWATIDEFKAELTRLLGTVRIQSAALTDVGMVREHNEDAVMALEYVRESLVDPAELHLYVVADGMGGAEAGEVASAIAVGTIRSYVEERITGAEVADPGALMAAALEDANQKIIKYVTAHPESNGMGSTAVAALVTPPNAAVAWVGDSRVYLMDGGSLRQVTKDHSLVQRLVEIGQITPAEARTHEHKNVITRGLGARSSGPAGAESVRLRLKRGDRMLLCSDGLTTHVEDNQVADILRRHHDPGAAARELITAANAGGGTDNISVIVLYAS
ncbi:MAG TPA: Stp1/IreP family PP2C-type Ser/Thr phosphatase [Candidatus Binataceae bacterium]